jgi:hypothetical protein
VSARKENNINANGDDVTVNNFTRRRFIALAEVGLELSLVAWCELNFRPKAAGDAEMNLWESILSLRPYKTPTETRNLAQVRCDEYKLMMSISPFGHKAVGDLSGVSETYSHHHHDNNNNDDKPVWPTWAVGALSGLLDVSHQPRICFHIPSLLRR